MPKPEKAYPVRLVGTHSYQPAIMRVPHAATMAILREPDNPYDDGALVVVDGEGRTLGYVPRDSWLRRLITEEGRGARVEIAEISIGADRIAGMTIFATPDVEQIGTRDFVPAD